MEIQPEQPSVKGRADWFTGDVWLNTVAKGKSPSRLLVGAVHFAPGARTAWHFHDRGQTLYVTEGKGLVQSRGGQIAEIRPGDVVYAGDGEEHWHGATPENFMSHLSFTEGSAHWGAQVTDGEYEGYV